MMTFSFPRRPMLRFAPEDPGTPPTVPPAGDPPVTPPAPPTDPQTPPKLTNAEAAELRTLRKEKEAWEKAQKEREDAEKTELQRERERAEQSAREAIEARREAIGAKHGLPEELWGRIHGSTKEEMEADAQALKALVKTSQPPTPGTTGQDNKTPPAPAPTSHTAEWQRLKATDPQAAQAYYAQHREDILRNK